MVNRHHSFPRHRYLHHGPSLGPTHSPVLIPLHSRPKKRDFFGQLDFTNPFS